ncbi:NAD(P)H-dependent glycerol-3-phosphate dehydrogenase [bacterium]|nr:NAD(P)H-dependent glycerol-3-phosphate dehydrogenase [bacterium]
MVEELKITVVGAGSWGTALAILLAGKGFPVRLWVYETDLCQVMQSTRENLLFLPGFKLPANIEPINELAEAVSDSDFIILVVPSHVFRGVLSQMVPYIHPDSILVSATKGIENDSLARMSEIMIELLPETYHERIAILSGPSFAREVCQQTPTTVVVASKAVEVAERVQLLMTTPYFRTYTNNDIVGVEIGGALKNVIAIAAGTTDGLGFGANTKAALLTRGLAEMTRLGLALGANPLTFAGLSGMGDLILTCNSALSRNYTTGYKLGQGNSLEKIVTSMHMVAEGIKTTQSAYQLALRLGVEMPIIEQVHAILFENKKPELAVYQLMTRKLKRENHQIQDVQP